MLVECLDNLIVPLPVFVLFGAPWFQSSPPHKSYRQLCFCCYVRLTTFQLISACINTPSPTHSCLRSHLFPTAVPPVSYHPAKSNLEERLVLEQVTIMQFKNKMLLWVL